MTVAVVVFALTVGLCLGIGIYVKTGLVHAKPGEVLLVTSMHGVHRLADSAIARGFVLVERLRTEPFEVSIELTGIHAPLAREGHSVDVRARLWLACPAAVDDAVKAARSFGAAGIGDPAVMQPILGPALEAAVLELVAVHTEAEVRERPGELADRVVKLLGDDHHGLAIDRCELATGPRVTESLAEGPFR